jgi:hypothetical protein
MGIPDLLNDKRFNVFFSFVLGIGLVCVFRPMCTGADCNIMKAPTDKDFDKYVYKMGGNKCYEFKSEIVECPTSGTIEAFRECSSVTNYEPFRDDFSRRGSPIKRCE